MEKSSDVVGALKIWDSDLPPGVIDCDTVLWRGFETGQDSRVVSLPRLVEREAQRFRSRYLAWVFQLGESAIRGKRVVDHMQLRAQFSYWWMTLLAQRFNASGTSPVHDAIKLLALEEHIGDRAVNRLILHSANAALAECLRKFCGHARLRFDWQRLESPRLAGLAALRERLWLPIQAMISLFRHVAQRRGGRGDLPALASNAQVMFIDVLVHLDKKAFATGAFVSNYWTALVERLAQAGTITNWLHTYFKYEAVPTFEQAEALVRGFTARSEGRERHVLLESHIKTAVLVCAVGDYARLCWKSVVLRGVQRHFRAAGSSINLWPLFRQEWMESLRGRTAIINCLGLALFETALVRAPRQKLGVYIQENQPWEMALIHAWRTAGHGELIGVPHTTVRYWDLRYFYDPRSYGREAANALPMPDKVAVNGPIARATYIADGYPPAHIIDVEALRYLHLRNTVKARGSRRSPFTVLVCGDFLPATSHKILACVTIAARSLPPQTRFLFKPHPAYPVDLSRYSSVPFEPMTAPLGELLPECDVVLASNITSAAIDAYCCGVPVVQLLDGDTFNMSPLRSIEGCVYVTAPQELAQFLINGGERYRGATASYFHLDGGLPRWSKVLGIAQ